MKEIISLIIIGIALSMDTFSLALSVGTLNISFKKAFSLSFIVGIFHFCMPILGMFIGNKIIEILELRCDIILGVILIIIAIEMLIDIIKHEEDKWNLSILGMFGFAIGVSIDSFSIGLGINAISNNIFLATSIFALCSFLFTFGGLIIGKYVKKLIGIYANILGFLILFILGILHLI